MSAEPMPTAVTNPLDVTVATLVLVDDHTTATPETGFPLASRGTADNRTVSPRCTSVESRLRAINATRPTASLEGPAASPPLQATSWIEQTVATAKAVGLYGDVCVMG